MKIICLDAGTLGCPLDRFKKFGEFLSFDFSSKEEAKERLKDADVVILNKFLMDADVIQAAPKLKLILITATGTNNIDLECAKDRGIVVKNVAGYSTQAVAQHSLALLLGLLNFIPYYDEWTKEGKWCAHNKFCDFSRRIHTIQGKKYGIIGMGAIGRKMAEIISALGGKVCYYSSSGVDREPKYQRVELGAMFKECEIISIHAPLNERTKNLVNKELLFSMRENAVLINTGRGGIVDEHALAAAIDERGLRVGLDVLECEPMNADNPLLKVKNKDSLIITPHIAWAAVETVDKLLDLVANNLTEWIENGK